MISIKPFSKFTPFPPNNEIVEFELCISIFLLNMEFNKNKYNILKNIPFINCYDIFINIDHLH